MIVPCLSNKLTVNQVIAVLCNSYMILFGRETFWNGMLTARTARPRSSLNEIPSEHLPRYTANKTAREAFSFLSLIRGVNKQFD